MPINYKDYHPKWKLIRRLILRRAGNRCERCGIPNYTRYQSEGRLKKVILTIAHLDRDVNNNRFSNLESWCQRCHLNYDRGDNLAKMKYGKEYKKVNLILF
ncbi:MAG: hypothetical protein HC831_08305 [Chloroflexia bacterium]|nr:hypothetical protein [Chloroflexia bacterium]